MELAMSRLHPWMILIVGFNMLLGTLLVILETIFSDEMKLNTLCITSVEMM